MNKILTLFYSQMMMIEYSSYVDRGKSKRIFLHQQKYLTPQQKKQISIPISQNLQHL